MTSTNRKTSKRESTLRILFVVRGDTIFNIQRLSDFLNERYTVDPFHPICFTGEHQHNRRLLQEIRSGKIDLVITPSVDHISPKQHGVAKVISMCREHRIRFLSLDDNIDTTPRRNRRSERKGRNK